VSNKGASVSTTITIAELAELESRNQVLASRLADFLEALLAFKATGSMRSAPWLPPGSSASRSGAGTQSPKYDRLSP
jgi:hypothetical protein